MAAPHSTQPPMKPAPAAAGTVQAAPPEERERKKFLAWLFPLLPLLFIGVAVLVVVIMDARLKPSVQSSSEAGVARTDMPDLLDTQPRIDIQYHDFTETLLISKDGVRKPTGGVMPAGGTPIIWQPSGRFGLVTASDPKSPSPQKRLNYVASGTTNNTCVRLDGQDSLWGEVGYLSPTGSPVRELGPNFPPGARPLPGVWKGRWEKDKEPLGNATYKVGKPGAVQSTSVPRAGRKSTWVYDEEKVYITQTVEVVPGPSSRLLDTCLVTYRIENKDTRPHQVGLRFLLDTFIGTNDGVPFSIPADEQEAAQLCDTMKVFDGQDRVPDFIQALEKQDLKNPGTVVQVNFRIGGKELLTPDKVTLGAWPSAVLRNQDPKCWDQYTLWDVPVMPIKQIQTVSPGAPPDSAVVMYWNPRTIAPGQTVTVGYGYGLGQVASSEQAAGRIGLSVGGTLVVDYTFTVTALVSDAKPGETVTLELPPSFKLVRGELKQTVPPPSTASGHSLISWKVKASKDGMYALKAQLSNGMSQKLDIEIKNEALFGGSGR